MRVLIVEDDLTSRRLLQSVLSPYGQCDFAVNGREALESYKLAMEGGEPYGLVCLDIMMPELDGHEVLRQIRQLETVKNIPQNQVTKVIVTSSLGDSTNVIGAFQEGCEAYLEKPIETEKLLNQLGKLGLIVQ